MNEKQQKIEALLFFKNEPVSFLTISKYLSLDIKDVKNILFEMLPFYENRGFTLIITENKVSLMTSEISMDLIKEVSSSEERKELSRQALETLSIILYKRFITKSELDYIRGVNSMFILRNLLIRGLIEKEINKKDGRSVLYTATNEALSFLGVKKVDDLPQFNFFKDKLNKIETEFIKNN